MSSRTHLSISEVLSLLKDDFPDLTITKIRYLESQGLIAPERTASGYRKFYKFDIDRLRWILRQQRENFLPLKVIKKRLDNSDGNLPADDADASAQPELDLARDPGKSDPPPVWMADHAKSSRGHTSDTAKTKGATVANPSSGKPDRTDEPAATDSGTERAAATRPAKANARAKESESSNVESGTSTAPTVAPAAPKPPSAPKVAPKAPTATTNTHAEAPTVPNPTPAPAGEVGAGHELDQGPSDVSLTRSELLKAAGLTERQLSDLESFGIVVGSNGLDSDLYGSTALISARHAATLLSLGVEPRHLRAYKVAADREAGLYEQLLLPLLRQRNPAARAEAIQTLEQVTRAGNAIHAALLKQALRGLLRPGN